MCRALTWVCLFRIRSPNYHFDGEDERGEKTAIIAKSTAWGRGHMSNTLRYGDGGVLHSG